MTVFAAQGIRAQKLEIGAKFDVNRLSSVKKSADNTIIVFVPSLTYDCDYASMLTQSFYYYFDQRLAFEGLKKAPVTRIFLLVADKQDAAKSVQNILGGMEVVYDEAGAIFAQFGVKPPADKNADSVLVLLDSKQKIALVDENYRSQGEHLKPLENKLKELNGIYSKVKTLPSQQSLKVGDMAPDFRVSKDKMLSDFRYEVVLLSFYPAAFSGTLPKPIDLNSLTIARADLMSSLMSCSSQIGSLDLFKNVKIKQEAKKIVISSSSSSLLEKWRKVLGTYNIEYANDADYSVSAKYLSYNPAGYNNRVSVIIDQKGRVAYIDESFETSDEIALEAKIEELMAKK
jgi:peroxiredoxin